MTRHPSLEQLRLVADDERASRLVAAHLQDCTPCRGMVAAIREITIAARDEFNSTPPRELFERVVRRRAEGERLILPINNEPAQFTPRGGRVRRAAFWSAGLLFGVAGVAAAFPGSPFREWLGARHAPALVSNVRDTARADVAAAAPRDTAVSEVSVPLSAGEGWVDMITRLRATEIQLRITDGVDLDVRGIGPAARAVFGPRAGGIRIVNELGGRVQIDVPRVATRFVLRIGGVPHVVMESGRLRVLSAAVDSAGADLLVIARP
jgi:hypothetical protein